MAAIRLGFLVAALYGLAACGALVLRSPLSASTLMTWAFAGAAGATQLGYLLVAHDPVRFRPVIPVGIVSKLSFALPAASVTLAWPGTVSLLGFAAIDLVLAVGFAVAFVAIGRLGQPNRTLPGDKLSA